MKIDDHQKAALFLYVLHHGIPDHWGAMDDETGEEKQFGEIDAQEKVVLVLSALCFDGDMNRAEAALEKCVELGIARKV